MSLNLFPLTKWQKIASCLLFITGVFSATQIYLFGCIGISELVIFVIAPYLYLKEYKQLKDDGFIPIIILIFLNMVGCVCASLYYGARVIIILKSLMTLYSMFATIVIFHKLLRGNFYGLRWFLFGSVISSFIKIFAFNPKVAISSLNTVMLDDESLRTQMDHPLFWMGRLFRIIQTVICGWFYHVPLITGYIMTVMYAIVLVNVTVSGRSSIAVTFAGLIILTLAGRSRKGLEKIKKHIIFSCIFLLSAAIVFKFGYAKLASSGILGEKAILKYEQQTQHGSSFIDFLRSGRLEFFIGLSAIFHNPLIGYGAMPVDREDLVKKYYLKYATNEDIERFIRFRAYTDFDGITLIPSHSHIIGFWISNGVFGLIIWLYVLKLLYEYYRKYITSLPQVFPYVCFMTPVTLWDMFFSPYTNRFNIPLLITCILFSKAAYRGVPVSDPVDMGLLDGHQR